MSRLALHGRHFRKLRQHALHDGTRRVVARIRSRSETSTGSRPARRSRAMARKRRPVSSGAGFAGTLRFDGTASATK